MRRVSFLLVAVIAVLLPAAGAAATTEQPTARVLVRLSGTVEEVVADLAEAGAEPEALRAYRSIPWVSAEVTSEGIEALEASSAVATVVPDRINRINLTESVAKVGADQVTTAGFDGTGYSVAVLDTGIDAQHPFLAGRVVGEACFSDGDCPGGTSTATGPGAAAPCTYSSSQCLHGTHVAGIAAGHRPSGSPSRGVAPGAGVVGVQVFSNDGNDRAIAWSSDIIAAMDWVHANNATLKVAAVNLSLGSAALYGSNCDSGDWVNSAYKAAIDRLRSIGVATVVSAGNAGSSTSISSPACVSTAVSVGSTTKSDTISSFSNRASFLSLMAPGSAITSSVPTATYASGFAQLSGTSMAAPHVAGAWALLKQAAPTRSVAEILTGLRATGVDVGGYPRIALREALTNLAAVPAPPTAFTATPADGAVDLTWTAPVSTGSPALTGFTLTWDTATVTLAADATSARVEATNGTPVSFSLVATNSIGASTPVTASATPTRLPAAPTEVEAIAGGRAATVSWTAPDPASSDVPLTAYRITPSSGAAFVVSTDTTTVGVAGLTAGTPYTFTVEALNPAGASPASEASNEVVPTATAPDAPAAVTATAGVESASVSWPAPADGGRPILDYTVTPTIGSIAPVTTSSTSATFAVPAGTTTSFTVTARNDVGTSAAVTSNAVTAAAPPAPAPEPEPAPAPAPAPVVSSGGGGGGGAAPAPRTTTTAPRTTTTTRPPTTTTTAPPAPITAPATAAAAVPGGVLTVIDGVPTFVKVPTPPGTTVVAAASTPKGDGAWVATANGDVIPTGAARDHGGMTNVRLNRPIVGMASTATGKGYWLLGADGGIFSFGDAAFFGSTGAMKLNQPINTMAATPTGRGYWLLAGDGGVFTFGDARFLGSTGAMKLNQPITAMAPTPTSKGYWLVAGDGGVFTFGDARFAGAGSNGKRVTALAPTRTGRGYWLLTAEATSIPYGDARSAS